MSILIYGGIIFIVKKVYFFAWTWQGFFTDLINLTSILVVFLPSLVILWKVYSSNPPDQVIIRSIRSILLTENIKYVLSIQVVLLAGISIFLLKYSPSLNEEIEYFLRTHNWTYSKEELENWRKKPIKSDYVQTLDNYIFIHEILDEYSFPESHLLRTRKDVVDKLLNQGVDYNCYNLLSKAELSKIIYMVEDDETLMDKTLAILQDEIVKDSECSSQILKKIGEYKLVKKEYEESLSYFRNSLRETTDKTQISLLLGNIGNAYSALNKFDSAIFIL